MICFAHNMLPTLASSISKGDLLMMKNEAHQRRLSEALGPHVPLVR